jgi:hypothetical protein
MTELLGWFEIGSLVLQTFKVWVVLVALGQYVSIGLNSQLWDVLE